MSRGVDVRCISSREDSSEHMQLQCYTYIHMYVYIYIYMYMYMVCVCVKNMNTKIHIHMFACTCICTYQFSGLFSLIATDPEILSHAPDTRPSALCTSTSGSALRAEGFTGASCACFWGGASGVEG